jgi:putative ABC transport system permease protein
VGVIGLSSSSQARLLAEIDRLGTNLLTVETGQSLDHVQLVAHTGLVKDEKV